MSEEINYRKCVNQQLAGAAFQLSLLDNNDLSLSKLQQTSCRQGALHHLSMAVKFYINEILSSYKRENINFQNQVVDKLFSSGDLKQYAIVEFNELQQWYEKNNSLLSRLFTINQESFKDKIQTNEVSNKNIIVTESTIEFLHDNHSIRQLKSEFTKLIDRQRESLLEH